MPKISVHVDVNNIINKNNIDRLTMDILFVCFDSAKTTIDRLMDRKKFKGTVVKSDVFVEMNDSGCFEFVYYFNDSDCRVPWRL